jgi:hypothetical protein
MNNATVREAMAHTLVETSQYGMAERMRADSEIFEGMFTFCLHNYEVISVAIT